MPDGVDWVCERQVAEERVNFLPANGRGMLLYLERGYCHRWRQQQVVALEEGIKLRLQPDYRAECSGVVSGGERRPMLHRLAEVVRQLVRPFMQQVARGCVCV